MHKCDLWGSTSQDPTGVEIMMVSKCRRRFLTWQRWSALGLSPPQLLLLLPFLGFATSDLWILKFSRISLQHVLVSTFRVLQCSWQNCGPSLSFCFAIYRFPSKELCISTVCDSLREKPYRIILHHFLSISALIQELFQKIKQIPKSLVWCSHKHLVCQVQLPKSYQQKHFNKQSELINLSFLFLSATGQLANMTKNSTMHFLFEVIHNILL